MTLIAVFIALLFLHSLFSGRLERTIVTAPLIFTAAGMLVPAFLPGLPGRAGGQTVFLYMAEAGLVLLLFADAARTDLHLLKRISNLPVRLLTTGMLLTILLGALGAWAIFPGLSIWEAGILAAILAPTDAGLGQIIVNSPCVPLKVRQALNVEAGLNDGLSVPFLLFFMALAGGAAGGEHAGLIRFIVEQLGLGTLVGLTVGLVGGGLLGVAHRRKWMAHSWRQFGVVALPLLSMLVSEATGASMFIAAFVAGLAVQFGFKDAAQYSVEFTEEWGHLLNLSVFFLFGLLVTRVWSEFEWLHALYAVLSLTVVRMVPVAIALLGTRLCRATVLFLGWFGPRGLASIVLGLVFLEKTTQQPGDSTIRLAVMMTVMCSIFAHGLSALRGMEAYARKINTLPSNAPELEGISAGGVAQTSITPAQPTH